MFEPLSCLEWGRGGARSFCGRSPRVGWGARQDCLSHCEWALGPTGRQAAAPAGVTPKASACTHLCRLVFPEVLLPLPGGLSREHGWRWLLPNGAQPYRPRAGTCRSGQWAGLLEAWQGAGLAGAAVLLSEGSGPGAPCSDASAGQDPRQGLFP